MRIYFKIFRMMTIGTMFLQYPGITQAIGPGAGNTLDINEKIHLLFMRAEEKLAHDVYFVLGEKYPDYAFTNIVDSETNHTDSMIDALDKYDLEDPNIDDGIGEFNEANFGEYFSQKFYSLTTLESHRPKDMLLEALKNGALIEELDMHDIVSCPKVIVDADNGIGEDECGMDYTDENLLISKYDQLLEGSKDHLRAFVRQIESTFPDEYPYQAQYLEQEVVDEILGR